MTRRKVGGKDRTREQTAILWEKNLGKSAKGKVAQGRKGSCARRGKRKFREAEGREHGDTR